MKIKQNLTAIFILISCSSYASTTITNLNTQMQLQQLQRQQTQQNLKHHDSVTHGGGYPVYDATAIEQAKREMYKQWKRENQSEINYEDWFKTYFKESSNGK
ncbi:hypothetical protein IQ576_004467 [Salmonella enterica]|uniref:hypothetical protein n=1 Tax=Salmonella enterica TaxID=28901 RepID=UPI0009B090BA|nr:hypothetical protein [Salmonella enterica]EEU4651028.1 hypothetical protein [Escherichia coli]EBB1157090.1 hypothetical protein [Salmonella enterica]EBH7464633.1 hypothetical protein [Salmonella enterica]ECI9258025.1 hypothetical protein [Salmonella enterica]ECQ3417032.1 hypothetical protein [Salmonella enterica]